MLKILKARWIATLAIVVFLIVSLLQIPGGSSSNVGVVQAEVAVKLELVRGDVDKNTGRGEIGLADEVLHTVGEDPVPASNPTPHVVLNKLTVTNVRLNSEDRLVADIHISGYCTFALADIIPTDEANLTIATIQVADRDVDTVKLQEVNETPSILRPYARKFTFSKSLTAVPVTNYDVPVIVKVADPVVLGNTGWDRARFRVLASRNKSTPGDGSSPGSNYFLTNGLSQPLKARIDFGQFISLEEAAAGDEAILVQVKRTYGGEIDPLTVQAGLSLTEGENPVISVACRNVVITLTDITNLGLAPDEKGVFEAGINIPSLYGFGRAQLRFEETAADSNVFESQFVEVSLSFDSELDPKRIDTIQARVRESFWETVGIWEEQALIETNADSKVFKGPTEDFAIKINRLTDFRSLVLDDLTVMVSNALLSLEEVVVDAQETGLDTKVFDTEQVLIPLPWDNNFADAWIKGPWEVTSIAYDEGSIPGPYVPLMIKVSGDRNILLGTDVKCEIFGIEHDLIEDGGIIFCAGDKKPGVYTATGYLKVGEVFGAGHVSKKEGFFWATLKGTAIEKPLKSNQANIFNTAKKLYDELKKVADERRAARFGDDPGSSYHPKYITGQVSTPVKPGEDDPYTVFTKHIWEEYFVKAMTDLRKLSVDDTVRNEALKLMTKDDPKRDVFGIPATPDWVYFRARDKKIFTIGSKRLIGHWYPGVVGISHQWDFTSQTQNVTDILHLGTGMGWGKLLRPKMMKLVNIITTEKLTDKERKKAVMDWLGDNGFLDDGQKKKVKTYGEQMAFDYVVSKNDRFKKLWDTVVMARAYGGSKINALDMFMSYDIVSGEGFNVFGIDAFNDVIVTGAGRRLAEELRTPGAKIATLKQLRTRFDFHMNEARKAFLRHSVMKNREKVLNAFFSVMVAMEGDSFVPVKVMYKGEPRTIWEATIGTILQNNKDKLKTGADRKALIDKIVAHLKSQNRDKALNHSKAVLTKVDVKALNQVIEVLSLINQPRE